MPLTCRYPWIEMAEARFQKRLTHVGAAACSSGRSRSRLFTHSCRSLQWGLLGVKMSPAAPGTRIAPLRNRSIGLSFGADQPAGLTRPESRNAPRAATAHLLSLQ